MATFRLPLNVTGMLLPDTISAPESPLARAMLAWSITSGEEPFSLERQNRTLLPPSVGVNRMRAVIFFTNGEIDSPSVFFLPSRSETEISVIPALQEPTQCFSLVSAPAPTAAVPTSSAMLRSNTKSFLHFFINMPPSKRYFYHTFDGNTPFRL